MHPYENCGVKYDPGAYELGLEDSVVKEKIEE